MQTAQATTTSISAQERIASAQQLVAEILAINQSFCEHLEQHTHNTQLSRGAATKVAELISNNGATTRGLYANYENTFLSEQQFGAAYALSCGLIAFNALCSSRAATGKCSYSDSQWRDQGEVSDSGDKILERFAAEVLRHTIKRFESLTAEFVPAEIRVRLPPPPEPRQANAY